ncbi:unnamed protein product [Pleuronectes platessa]|uniref:Uncharacterized protein n=1 Tax=Pleuronectes platessa TaxID=8262 RepID=A0A9N7Z3G1_PLEPL|nr:unnamed protein product [Pleuronectes platessa]
MLKQEHVLIRGCSVSAVSAGTMHTAAVQSASRLRDDDETPHRDNDIEERLSNGCPPPDLIPPNAQPGEAAAAAAASHRHGRPGRFASSTGGSHRATQRDSESVCPAHRPLATGEHFSFVGGTRERNQPPPELRQLL